MIIDACKKSNGFQFLYPNEMKLRQRVEKIATTVYGADGVDWSAIAESKAKFFESDPIYDDYSTMMVKTQLSLTHIPERKVCRKDGGFRYAISCCIPARNSSAPAPVPSV